RLPRCCHRRQRGHRAPGSIRPGRQNSVVAFAWLLLIEHSCVKGGRPDPVDPGTADALLVDPPDPIRNMMARGRLVPISLPLLDLVQRAVTWWGRSRRLRAQRVLSRIRRSQSIDLASTVLEAENTTTSRAPSDQ